MTSSKEALQARLDEIDAEAKKLADEYTANRIAWDSDEELNVLRDSIHELYMKKEVIDSRYERKREDITARQRTNQKLHSETRSKLNTLKAREALLVVADLDAVEARGILHGLGIQVFPVNDKDKQFSWDGLFHLRKTLKNGVRVFQNSDESHNAYFAFDKNRLVGFWSKRKAQHRGDDTYSKCWFGAKVWKLDKGTVVYSTADNYPRHANLSFNEWCSVLEGSEVVLKNKWDTPLTTVQSKLVAVDLDNPVSIETMQKALAERW